MLKNHFKIDNFSQELIEFQRDEPFNFNLEHFCKW